MITDGLNSYRVAAEEVLPLAEHVREIHITEHKKSKDNNNRMERLNGTIRDREKTFWGLQGKHTTEFCGLRVNYNHLAAVVKPELHAPAYGRKRPL